MNWIMTLADPNSRVGRVFDRIIYVLILLSLVLFALETLAGAERYETWFTWSERVIVGLFTIE